MPDLDDIPIVGRMGNKVGPLPAWAWAAIPAGAYVAWSYYRASQGDSSVVLEDESTGGAAGTDAMDYGVNAGGVSLPGYGTAPNGSSNLPVVDTPRFDNTAWYKAASNYLIGEGVAAMDAVTALSAYIYGHPTSITQTQFNALQKAITKLGAAPDGSFIPTVTPPTTTPTPPVVTVPEAPTTVSASLPASTTTRITWGTPQSTGGSAIIGFKVELWHYDTTAKVWKINASKLTLAATRTVDFYTPARNHYFLGKVSARNIKGYGPQAGSQSVRTAAK